jgi:hypothetical protein
MQPPCKSAECLRDTVKYISKICATEEPCPACLAGAPGRGTCAARLACPKNMASCTTILPPSRGRDQSRRRFAESGSVRDKGAQDRRDAGGPLSPSGLQSLPAEKQVAVPWVGHIVSAVGQASRGVQSFVGPARPQVCARSNYFRGARSCTPDSQCLQSKTYPRRL